MKPLSDLLLVVCGACTLIAALVATASERAVATETQTATAQPFIHERHRLLVS